MREVLARKGSMPFAADSSAAFLSINSKVRIVGDVEFDGPVQIDGIVVGDVRCASILIAKCGSVEGRIVASTVTVAGTVNGSIFADKLVLKTACDVEGEICYGELALEVGSYFEGKSRPHKSPLGQASNGELRAPSLRIE